MISIQMVKMCKRKVLLHTFSLFFNGAGPSALESFAAAAAAAAVSGLLFGVAA